MAIATTPSPSPPPTAPLQATGAALHGGEVGVAYSAPAPSATGGAAPYTWSVFSGALPAGLTLGKDGSISGTPATAGNFAFTVQVTDAGSSTTSIPATIAVAPALSVGLIGSCAQYCNVELGCDSTCGAFGQQSGGAGPYAYSLTGGQLPSGTSLNGLSLQGTFKGLSGWLQFTVQVSDSLGGTASVSPKFWMYDHLTLAGGNIPTNPNNGCFEINAPSGGCTASFPYGGGTPNAGTPTASETWITPSCAPLPNVTVGGGQVTIAVNGGLSRTCNGWSATLRVVLTNADRCAGGAQCTAAAEYVITVLPT